MEPAEPAERREPIFNVPGTVLAIVVMLFAIHFASQFLSVENWTWFVLVMAFIPARYGGNALVGPDVLPGGTIAALTSPFTHMIMHADFVHLMMNSAWLLAFGSVLTRRMGALRFLAFSTASGLAGALLFYLLHPGMVAVVIGASGAIAGMMGGVMRFLLSAIDRRDGPALREAPETLRRMTIKECLSDRRIVFSSIIFIAVNLLAIYGFGTFGTAGTVAWEAHLGGYIFGLFAFALFDIAPQKTLSSQENTHLEIQ